MSSSSSRIQFRDITREPDAREKASTDPDLRYELTSMGFREVGVLEVSAPQMFTAEQAQELGDSPDAERLRSALQNGEVDEIFTSPDRRAFGVIDPFFGGPVVNFRTILENGMVVETTMKPARRPDLPFPMGAPQSQKERMPPFMVWENLFLAFMTRMMQLGLGQAPLWARQNRPGAGYLLELVETRSPRTLWQRHQERVNAQVQRTSQAIRPHDTLDLLVCICKRSYQITDYQGRWLNRINWALVLTFVAFCYVLVFWFSNFKQTLQRETSFPSVLLFLGVLSLFVIGPGLLMFPLLGLVRTRLMPLLPGPSLEPVSRLLEKYRLSL